jgi:ribonuclease R
MKKFSGESFGATVSGVANFGLFVELDEMGIEGLIHSTNLENQDTEYELGDKLEVVLNKVDMKQRKIDFLIKPDSE